MVSSIDAKTAMFGGCVTGTEPVAAAWNQLIQKTNRRPNDNCANAFRPETTTRCTMKMTEIDAMQIEIHLRNRLQHRKQVRRKDGVAPLGSAPTTLRGRNNNALRPARHHTWQTRSVSSPKPDCACTSRSQ
jgi:hypothetical protein